MSDAPNKVQAHRFKLNAFLLISACLFFSCSVYAQSKPTERVVLQLKWSHQFQFAGYYMAKHMGYYQDAGLDVEIRPGSPTLNVTEQVISGKADFGVGTSSLLVDYAAGKPVVVLGVIYQHSPLVLIMRSEKPSDTIERLGEGPVMIEAHSGDLLAMLRRSGLSPDDLNIVDRPKGALDLLKNKPGISSISAYQTDEPYTLNREGVNFVTFSPRTYGIDFYGDNFFTSKKMVEDRKDLVKRFRQATIQGWKEALRDPDKAIDYILKEYPEGKNRENLDYEARIPLDLMTKLVDPGYMNTDRWQHISDTFLETGMLEQAPDLSGFIFENESRPLPKWFWPTILSALVLLFLSMLIVIYLKNLNIRLQREVDLRLEVEKNLKEWIQ